MKFSEYQGALGAAILALSFPCDAKHANELSPLAALARRHTHHKRMEASPRAEALDGGLQKRGTCAFPTDAGLVPVTPGAQNDGWAMSPDQPCKADSYCPYACPPGQVMAQWSPEATAYVYPESMAGGLYCGSNGQATKPFPNKPYCVDGTGSVVAQNKVGQVISFCQTVLPGNEAMLIPTHVGAGGQSTLAVPDPSYWASTAAHYYINPPGVDTTEGCVWGDGSKPIGNWSPYVAGANTDGNGNTFVKIGYNPIWLDSSFKNTAPTFGIKIECPNNDCNGTPCAIDPSKDAIGGVESSLAATGAGGGNFCVVTVPKGSKANIVVFGHGGSGATDLGSNGAASGDSSSSSSSSTSTTSSTTSSSTSSSSTSTKSTSTSSEASTTSSSSSSASATASNSVGQFFQESSTTTAAIPTSTTAPVSSTAPASVSPSPTKSSATETLSSSSIFSFIVMFAFAGFML